MVVVTVLVLVLDEVLVEVVVVDVQRPHVSGHEVSIASRTASMGSVQRSSFPRQVLSSAWP